VEYSLVFVPVISVGHLSTNALAAISLGSMTAAVTGLSILQGLSSALDTLLPTTWTSSQPHLMGLWAQRMGTSDTIIAGAFLKLIHIRGNFDGDNDCEF
jgi:MATE family multidrug resistance protein